MLRQAHGRVANADGVLDDVLELVLGVAWAELARVRVHGEGHLSLSGYGSVSSPLRTDQAIEDGGYLLSP